MPLHRPLKALLISVLAFFALIMILIVFLVIVFRLPLPKTKGSLTIHGLEKSVEIVRDNNGIPHIYAQSEHDLYFGQGVVHAQDRFWQMELWRRIGAGRLSEYFGKSVLGTDIYLRTMGFARIAEKEYARLDTQTRKALDAYVAGVNAYIEKRQPFQLSLEFTLLGLQGVKIKIEPWTPIHTMTWLKVMAQDLNYNMSTELMMVDLLRSVGLPRIQDFLASYRGEEMPYIISNAEFRNREMRPNLIDMALLGDEHRTALANLNTRLVGNPDPERVQPPGDSVPNSLFSGSLSLSSLSLGSLTLGHLTLGQGTGIGSNGWVISGRISATGKPLLANDPHLGVQMPSIWYEVGLHCLDPENPFNQRGYSFAGAPGIVIGHNDRIAWGMTNMSADVQDLYIERINPLNPNQYDEKGVWTDMDLVYEEIRIRGEKNPYVLPVRFTRHGPIMTDHGDMIDYNGFGVEPQSIFPQNLVLTAMALRWTALEPNATLSSLLRLNRARNFSEFQNALRSWDVPAQNFIYADVSGNIAYQAAGRIPIRARGDGLFPAPGWTREFEWTGFVPFAELPRLFNPEKGYIVTANNPVTALDYPYFQGTDFDYGYRARRIADMIEALKGRISSEDIAVMQADSLNLSALEILPYLEPLIFSDRTLEAARNRLLRWNGIMEADSPDAALFGYFNVALVERTFKDQIPESLWHPAKALKSVSRLQNALYFLLKDPSNSWWDDVSTPSFVETRDDILLRSFEEAYARGAKQLGKNLDNWRWGKVHTVTFQNQTLGKSGNRLVEGIFNRGPFSVSGGLGQVSSTNFTFDRPFSVHSLSSMRQIIDLADFSRSLFMHTTGQSGHPAHRHYDDFINSWLRGQYHPDLWEREDADSRSEGLLILKPAPQ
ncbi:MAG TPA: penicillin acylase family protein [Spirochaetia bacterium]|nr:penicillin acylase family protein [Spirochaetia bacterium]